MPYATVCPGLLYSLSVVAIQFVWGVSTIRLGRLYSQAGAICTGRMGCGNLELFFLIFPSDIMEQNQILEHSYLHNLHGS